MNVAIYTTPYCVYCKMAKEYFEKNNILYKEYDVASDLTARAEMLNKSHQMGVPVIEINNEVIVGFNRSLVDKALGLAR